jgi:hypothetical protein
MAIASGGGDAGEKRMSRRPTIRRRPVSPPRAAGDTAVAAGAAARSWTLPPPRLPEPRLPAARAAEPERRVMMARPILALVADDEAAGSDARSPAPVVGFWNRPQTLWAVVASFVLAAAATFVVQRASASASLSETSASATAITHTTSAPIVVPATRPAEAHEAVSAGASAPRAMEPSIPVVDVKSLPAVRRAPARAPTIRRPL